MATASSQEASADSSLPSPPCGGLRDLLKFLIPSGLGILLFLIPVTHNGQPTIIVGVIGNHLISWLDSWIPVFVVGMMLISAAVSLLVRITDIAMIRDSKLLSSLFFTSDFWLAVRFIGASIGLLVLFQAGPAWLYADDTGGLVLNELLKILVVFFLLAGLLLPLLLDFGLVEMLGSLMHKALRPIYTVPGFAAVDIIASLLGDGTVGTLITSRQYEKGYYTGREAAVIATGFSVVSITFSIVVLSFVGLEHMFLWYYSTVMIACLIAAAILPRIRPLSRIPDSYYVEADQGTSREPTTLKAGYSNALTKARTAPGILSLLKNGVHSALDIWIVFLPVIMTIATLGLVIAEHTTIFHTLASPLAYVLELFRLPEADKAAPAILLGFADMFLPATLAKGIESELTRFVIAALSITQLIYMSEVGVLILRSKIPLGFLHLLQIFLLRTIITLPIIILSGHIYFSM
ncbi:YjiH family protein [Spongorhabdus nitratireducens]